MADGNNVRAKNDDGNEKGKPLARYLRKRLNQGKTPVSKPSLGKTKEEAVEAATEQLADSNTGP